MPPLFLTGIAALILLCIWILWYVARDILRVMCGSLEDLEDKAARRTEERKNQRIRREIQQRRQTP